MKSRGKIFILSGPSGAGKTTLHKKLLNSRRFKGKLVKSVSVTTRPKRAGEKHGRDYIFISPKMFRYKQRAGHFLESERVFDHYYGTPKKNVRELLRQGKHVLLCIDVKGARTVRREHPQAVSIFITVPSEKELEKRLRQRGSEDQRSRALRLKIARREMKEVKHYDYIVVNDQLGRARKKLEQIISQEINDKAKE